MPTKTKSSSVTLPAEWVLDAELARRSLKEFIVQAWPLIEPATRFVDNWHIDVIAEYLEYVSAGEIQNLLINVPPRCMKSIIMAVMWPAWEWTNDPTRRFLFSSYAMNLASRDSVSCRRLIESYWYQRAWSSKVVLTSDQNVKTRFENSATGLRIATSVGGSATGEGADRVVCDDPHDIMEAESEAHREETVNWWNQVMMSRVNDPKRSARVVVAQRTHVHDLSASLIEQGYTHVCLPMEYVPQKYFCPDPRSRKGELLWEERFGPDEVANWKKVLGSYSASSQLQQDPQAPGGTMFQRHWFKILDTSPIDARRARGWDKAATEDDGDYTVGAKVARDNEGRIIIENIVRGQWSAAKVDAIVRQTTKMDGIDCVIGFEQEPGSAGKSDVEYWKRELFGYSVYAWPSTGEKSTNWRPLAVQAEAGNVYLVRAPWNEQFLEELTNPAAEHDDIPDAVARAQRALMETEEFKREKGDYGVS